MYSKEAINKTLHGGKPVIDGNFVEIRGSGMEKLNNSLVKNNGEALVLVHPCHFMGTYYEIMKYRQTNQIPDIVETRTGPNGKTYEEANFGHYSINIASKIIEASKNDKTVIVYTKNDDYLKRKDDTVKLALELLEASLFDVAGRLRTPIFFITTPSGYPFPITDTFQGNVKNFYSLGAEFAKQLKILGLEQARVGGTYYEHNGWGCVNRTLDDLKKAKIEANPIRGLTYMELVPLDVK